MTEEVLYRKDQLADRTELDHQEIILNHLLNKVSLKYRISNLKNSIVLPYHQTRNQILVKSILKRTNNLTRNMIMNTLKMMKTIMLRPILTIHQPEPQLMIKNLQ